MGKHEDLTQAYSTFGSKLLAHTDVLHSIQNDRKFKPITVQLAPTEVCESDCAFCSVAERPLKSSMPWIDVEHTLTAFKNLGAKSLEVTGGGNPLLYRDKDKLKNINDLISKAYVLGYDIGIITNSHDLRAIDPKLHPAISWIRISLIKLDEGKQPIDYNFNGYPENKIGLSYIIYEGVSATPRTHRKAEGTTIETIHKLAKMVELHPDVKFVRIAGNCLIKGNNASVRDKWRPIIDEVDKFDKFFVKDIGNDDSPFNDGCYVGMVRPYVAPAHDGNGYRVYTCTSHVLNTRNYSDDYVLCDIKDIKSTWKSMNENFKAHGYPYSVKGNNGNGWLNTCKFCYYLPSNKVLHVVAHKLPDANFA